MAHEVKDAIPESGGDTRSIARHLVGKAGQKLVALSENPTWFQIIWRCLRWVTVALTVGFGLFLAGLWLATSGVGERNVTSAFLLYLPPALWVLPVPPLLFLGLICHRRALLVQLVMVGLFVWGWMGYEISGGSIVSEDTPADTLTILTYNRGQHMGQSLQPFKAATQPDLLVMQEAPGRAAGFLKTPEYQEFVDAKSIGEFTLLSRFPITDFALVAPPLGNSPRAARFVIDWKGRPVSVYAVHLQSPRDVLKSYQRGAFLWGVLGVPGTPWAAKRKFNQMFWDGQMADARTVLDAVRADPNPSLVAGDFNAPHTGYIHRLITRELGDAHEEAGEGFGLTFPGTTSNPLSAGGPWMRIDYLFFNRSWQAVSCVTERDRPSQHRAVAAKVSIVR